MTFHPRHISRLEGFFSRIKEDTYPEPPTEPHLSITRKMFDFLIKKYPLPQNARVLDIGCGQGLALELFKEKGLHPTGITLNETDASVCRNKGYDVFEMDQSFLDFEDDTFDFVWCRHCLEHSVFPYFTLQEFFRIIGSGGYLYVEVPAPDTGCNHQNNHNHYSVLGKSMWLSLLQRAGFSVMDSIDIDFEVPAGPDTYWAFILQKPNP